MAGNAETMSRTAATALMLAGALVMLAPFYFMFVFATQSRAEIFQLPPPLFFVVVGLTWLTHLAFKPRGGGA